MNFNEQNIIRGNLLPIEFYKDHRCGYIGCGGFGTRYVGNDYYKRIKSFFDDTEGMWFYYLTLGHKRIALQTINSMDETEYNFHIKQEPRINIYEAVEYFNFETGAAFQIEKELWQTPIFLEYEQMIIDFLTNNYLKDLHFCQQNKPKDVELLFDPGELTIRSLQRMRTNLEILLREIHHQMRCHKQYNPGFFQRLEGVSKYLEDELIKSDSILKKLFLKKDKEALSPIFNECANQIFWWENWENIQKLMEENGI